MMAKFLKYILCLSVLVVVLCIPSFAYTDGFVDQPIPYDANASQALASSVGYTYYGSQKVMSTVPNTFCFIVGTKCWIGYKGEAGGRYATSLSESSGMNDSFQAIPGWYFNANWFYVNSDYAQYYYMPVFSSIDAAVAAAELLIESSSASYSYEIPIGYVGVFESTGLLYFDTVFSDLSTSINVPLYGYWGHTGQEIGEITGYPVSGTQFPLASSIPILWGRGQPRNLFGQTYYGHAEHESFNNLMYVYNPVYRGGNEGFNSSITVSGSISGFRLYSLTSSVSSNDTIVGIVNDGDDYVSVDTDPDTDQPVYTDPEGDPVPVPQPGGDTLLPEPVSNSTFLQKIIAILDDLLSEIAGLFTFAFRAIASLVDAAAGFFTVIGGLFTWLPEEVVTVIVSGFILVVTIGVLKSFL